MREARILGVEAPSSHVWPSGGPWLSGSVGRVLTGPGPSCPAYPHPGSPLAPGLCQAAAAQSQTESCRGSTEVVSRAERPTSLHPNRENREGRGGVTPSPSTPCSTVQGREDRALGRGARGQCSGTLSCALHRESGGPLLRKHRGAGPDRRPTLLCAPPRGGLGSAENVRLWGTKSLNLGGGAAERGSSSPGVSPHQVGKTKARAGGSRPQGQLPWGISDGGSLAERPAWAGEGAAQEEGGRLGGRRQERPRRE